MADETEQQKAERLGWKVTAWQHVPGSWDAVVFDPLTDRRKGMALAQPSREAAMALAVHGAIVNPMA